MADAERGGEVGGRVELGGGKAGGNCSRGDHVGGVQRARRRRGRKGRCGPAAEREENTTLAGQPPFELLQLGSELLVGRHDPEASRRRLTGGGAARVQAVRVPAASARPSCSIDVSRILNFWILPVTVIGNSSTNTT